MRRQSKRALQAFSLVEVMVALFIVAAGAVMYYALMPMSFKTGAMVSNYQQASSLVQHKIDQLRGVGYGRLTYAELRNAGIIDSSPTTAPFTFKTVDNLNSVFPQTTATISVSDFSASIKQVTVTLTWTGASSKQGNGTLSATTLVAKS